jgi:hypothetical protein
MYFLTASVPTRCAFTVSEKSHQGRVNFVPFIILAPDHASSFAKCLFAVDAIVVDEVIGQVSNRYPVGFRPVKSPGDDLAQSALE